MPPIAGLAEIVTSTVASLDTFDFPIDMSETARTFGVQLTTIDEFIRSSVTSESGVAA
jgi:hypothetical protein